MNVEGQVLARVKPTPEEEASISDTVSALADRVMGTEAAKGHDIQLYLVGSIAKGTHLKDPDADIFLLFDPQVPRDILEKTGLAIGREAIGGREHYAEHPYIKGEFMGLRADIVPAYRILDSSQKMTAVDRTPFHTEYVKSNLRPELKDHVRLLKAFMKGIGAYGADSRTMGFSGYLCELLIIRFGGFRDLLENASGWKSGLRLELGQKTGREFRGPMTFIDPVDPNRNVASALSQDNLALFIAAARAYLDTQTLKFFFPAPAKPLGFGEVCPIIAGRGALIILTIPRPDLIDDILFPQMRKFERNVVNALSAGGFQPMDSISHAAHDRLVLIVESQSATLPDAMYHRGPPVPAKDNSAEFLAKWCRSPDAMSAPFIKDGHWNVLARRKHNYAAEYLGSCIPDMDVGKDLNRYREEVSIWDTVPDDKTILEALSVYLDRRMPWER